MTPTVMTLGISTILLVFISSKSVIAAPRILGTKPNEANRVEVQQSLMDDFTISELLSFIGYQELKAGNDHVTLDSIYNWGEKMSQIRGQEFLRSDAHDLFNLKDSDKDGRISLDEWEKDADVVPVSVMVKIFKFTNADTNQDGKVTRPEFGRWATDYAKVIGDTDEQEPHHMQSVFELKDENQDGVIDISEWGQFVDFSNDSFQ